MEERRIIMSTTDGKNRRVQTMVAEVQEDKAGMGDMSIPELVAIARGAEQPTKLPVPSDAWNQD